MNGLCEAFAEIAALAERLGVERINKLPGCWEHQVDRHWWIAVNAHSDACECTHGVTVPPYTAYVEFNGWLAGLIQPAGGSFAAGSLANEDTFIEALKNAGAE